MIKIMERVPGSFLLLLFALCLLHPGRLEGKIQYDKKIPQIVFAAQELEKALIEAGKENINIEIKIIPKESSPESFQIRMLGLNQIEVSGSDATGAMYGGLEVAELIRLGLPIENQEREPFVKKRGIKFNIPWDARTPSYDDTGDNAQINIETVWDFEFWKAYLDDLARYRYNVLSLWSTHPYPSIIQMEEYPEVALDDVYRVSEGIFQPQHKNRLQDVDLDKPGTMQLVKKISIEEKISHWQRVFQYAEDRGIEIYLFHWNVMTFGATGKYGITPDQTNPVTIDYMRKSVSQALLTYPNIKGIGVTAGENADNNIEGEYSIENFLFNTYGRGIMDVLEQQPDREVRFIFRQHMTGLGPITAAFADYPDEFNTSFKYAIGHMYSMRKPELFDHDFRDEVEEYQVPCWLNLRNDDMFVLRWGSPDFVREYIQKMPHDVMPGFYMGSDGYVWGREFVAKNPELAGRLEIDKHWYQFRQWGQLAYNPDLGRDYWEASLRYRFPGVDARLLYNAWSAVSEVVLQVNSATYGPNDAHFAPEGCIGRGGFLTVDDFYFSFWPMLGSGIHSVEEWGRAMVAGNALEGITPLQVADKLDEYAAIALAALPGLETQVGENAEFHETLKDIEAMAYLGRYYADKMRGAAKLAAFRECQQPQFIKDAVAHLTDALEEWKAYSAIVSSQYNTQLMARTHYMDWNRILVEVEKEVVTAEREGDFPEVRFTNLKDGEHFPAETTLQVEVDASDKDGIQEVKLYLNGLLLTADATNKQVWNASSDELLAALKPGMHRLKAVAVDQTGTVGYREIQIAVGEISQNREVSRGDEIHQVILNEGEVFMGGDVREFPRLEFYLSLRDDGRLALVHGSPDERKGMIWKAMMHNDHGDSHYTTLDKGQLVTYRGTPGHQEAIPFLTPPASGPGPYQFGITISKHLVIFRELAGGELKIVWKSEDLEPWRL